MNLFPLLFLFFFLIFVSIEGPKNRKTIKSFSVKLSKKFPLETSHNIEEDYPSGDSVSSGTEWNVEEESKRKKKTKKSKKIKKVGESTSQNRRRNVQPCHSSQQTPSIPNYLFQGEKEIEEDKGKDKSTSLEVTYSYSSDDEVNQESFATQEDFANVPQNSSGKIDDSHPKEEIVYTRRKNLPGYGQITSKVAPSKKRQSKVKQKVVRNDPNYQTNVESNITVDKDSLEAMIYARNIPKDDIFTTPNPSIYYPQQTSQAMPDLDFDQLKIFNQDENVSNDGTLEAILGGYPTNVKGKGIQEQTSNPC
uniref:Uncharacterized protein n=1 Tax=Meloidogyne hapla TaxID=6305 RepID=A0A1I8BYB6_MELHA